MPTSGECVSPGRSGDFVGFFVGAVVGCGVLGGF